MKQLISIIILLFFFESLFAQDEFTLVKEGEQAPDFAVILENGQTIKLSDFKGKVVWINFFATWCPPCREELPHLQKEVYDKYENNDNFVLIIVGREHTWEEVNNFKTEQNFTMPFYPDKERLIFSVYANQNIPRNFIIGKDGKIAVSSSGYTEEDFAKMKTKLADLIK